MTVTQTQPIKKFSDLLMFLGQRDLAPETDKQLLQLFRSGFASYSPYQRKLILGVGDATQLIRMDEFRFQVILAGSHSVSTFQSGHTLVIPEVEISGAGGQKKSESIWILNVENVGRIWSDFLRSR